MTCSLGGGSFLSHSWSATGRWVKRFHEFAEVLVVDLYQPCAHEPRLMPSCFVAAAFLDAIDTSRDCASLTPRGRVRGFH